jgi:hypothetical protein
VLGAGLSVGAAAMITPTRGALIALAALGTIIITPSRQHWHTLGFTLGGAAVVPVLVAVILVASGRGVDAFRDVILFPAQQYSSIQWMPFGHGEIGPLTYAYEVLAAAVLTLGAFRFHRIAHDPKFLSALALAGAGLLGAFPRPDLVHIGFTLPLALPLAAYCGPCFAVWLPRPVTAVGIAVMVALCVPTLRQFY